jgi:bifunctional UDP-N-acetylglucosamine pyrophosphorylase / glucosamine-1-phosphate N-acetyltransferase
MTHHDTTSPRPASESSPAVIVMAAGLGTRMKSEVPKVLHPVCGRPLVSYVLDAAESLRPARLIVVVGPDQDEVVAVLPEGAEAAVQAERRGSGDAVRAGMAPLHDFEGDVVVLNGDHPLMSAAVLHGMVERHRAEAATATVTTVVRDDPTFGRVIRDADGGVARIVEMRDATPQEAAVRELNVGFYVFDAGALRGALPRLTADNAQAEYYLTDAVHLLLADGRPVAAYVTDDLEATIGVNSRVDLAAVSAVMRRRILGRLMLGGVTVEDPGSTYVDFGVEVGRDTVIRPQTMLGGATRIGERCLVGPGCVLRDAEVGDDATILSSYLLECAIGDDCMVGPFAYIRPGTALDTGAKAGTFVEIKASTVGAGSKVPHLSYVGDATIGEGTNIGAGNITANYDGRRKHPTVIGDNVKTGSDTVFVAPVTVGDDAWTAAGSVITRDIPDGALGVARARQEVIERYAERRLQTPAPASPAGDEARTSAAEPDAAGGSSADGRADR